MNDFFCPLNSKSVLATVVDAIREYMPDCIQWNLTGNKIKSVYDICQTLRGNVKTPIKKLEIKILILDNNLVSKFLLL